MKIEKEEEKDALIFHISYGSEEDCFRIFPNGYLERKKIVIKNHTDRPFFLFSGEKEDVYISPWSTITVREKYHRPVSLCEDSNI